MPARLTATLDTNLHGVEVAMSTSIQEKLHRQHRTIVAGVMKLLKRARAAM